jgi:hypothetical protein
MNEAAKTSIDEQIASEIKRGEDLLGAKVKALNKVKAQLSRTRTKVSKPGWHIKVLQKLADDLRRQSDEPPSPDLLALRDRIVSHLQHLNTHFQRAFREELQATAKTAGLVMGLAADRLTIGPFGLSIDLAQETVALEYAKAQIDGSLPVDASSIVEAAAQVAKEILAEPTDIGKLAGDVDEAIRVCLARQNKRPNQPELRAELPGVYREMVFIRQGGSKPPTKKTLKEYPLARFVVEIAVLVQSDYNASANRHFRLEPAVIENAGNPKKSVFIPKDLSRGFGEGTYYQAIVLRTGN